MHLRLFISLIYDVTKHKEATTKQESQESPNNLILVYI